MVRSSFLTARGQHPHRGRRGHSAIGRGYSRARAGPAGIEYRSNRPVAEVFAAIIRSIAVTSSITTLTRLSNEAPVPAVIFGGAGFIGRHLAHALVARGHRPVILCDVAPPTWQLSEDMVFLARDVRRPLEVDGLDATPLVFNLAAVHRTPGHEDHEYHETNERGADNVVAFCERHEVRDLWFTSSIAVYGPTEDAVTEDSALAPVSAYGKSKAAAEATHEAWARREPGRRLVVVRPGTVFGPGEGGNFTRLAWAMKRRRFLYPGRRDTVKACGYVGDLVESMFFMQARADPTVIYNFSYGPPPTIEEVCTAFSEVGHLPRPVGTVPLPLILGASRLLYKAGVESFRPERVQKLNRSTNIHPKVLLESGYSYRTTLRTGLAAWLDAAPAGEFV
jgi:GlcNAc-P-P-Und epimerase